MKRYIQTIIPAAAVLAMALAPSAGAPPAAAQSETAREICNGVNIGSGGGCGGSGAGRAVSGIVETGINIFSLVVGVAAVIMIIVAAMKFVTSGGESSNIASARATLLYAVVGLVVVALAQFIVRFVLSRAT